MDHITAEAKTGYLYLAKFTDGYTRMRGIVFPKSKAKSADSLDLYN